MRLTHKAPHTSQRLSAQKHRPRLQTCLTQVLALTPTSLTTPADRPEARACFEQAFLKTYRWPKDFRGFVADLLVNENGRVSHGSVRVDLPQKLAVILPDSDLQTWAQEALAMMVTERTFCSFAEADGQYALTWEHQGHHPLGRLIMTHGDQFGSQYRVQERRVLQITRTIGTMRFVITVEDSLQAPDGRHLATSYVVHYFNTSSARLVLVESFKDTHVLVGNVALLARRLMISSEGNGVLARTLTLRNHQLL